MLYCIYIDNIYYIEWMDYVGQFIYDPTWCDYETDELFLYICSYKLMTIWVRYDIILKGGIYAMYLHNYWLD